MPNELQALLMLFSVLAVAEQGNTAHSLSEYWRSLRDKGHVLCFGTRWNGHALDGSVRRYGSQLARGIQRIASSPPVVREA
jgi:hypothetical protein